MKLKVRDILDLLSETNYLAIIFLVPLWFAYLFPTFSVFELNKIILFRVLVWSLLGLTLLKIIIIPAAGRELWQALGTRPSLFLKKYFLIPAVFLLGIGVTLSFSVDPSQSFFGSFARQQGWSSLLFFGLWLVLLVFNLLTVKNNFSFAGRAGTALPAHADVLNSRIRRLIKTAVLSGLAVSAYGLLQILGIDFLAWNEPAISTNRIFSTLGQPNFLASYLLLVIPLSIYLAYSSRSFLKRFFYILIGLSQILALFFTGSRGGLLAALIIVGLLLVYWLFSSGWQLRTKIILAVLGAVVMVGGISSLVWIGPERFREVFDYRDGSSAARVSFYQAAAAAILEKPWFGTGLENSGEVFIRYYEPDWGVCNKVGASTDRAHNLILDILLTSGFWGLAVYTLWYYWFFKLAGQTIRRLSAAPGRPLAIALTAGSAAYLLSLFFNFSLVAGEVYWWSYLALIIVLNYSSSQPSSAAQSLPDRGNRHWLIRVICQALAFVLILGAVLVAIRHNFQALEADYYFNKLVARVGDKDFGPALVLAAYIRQNNPNIILQTAYDRYLGHNLSQVETLDAGQALDELVVREQQRIFADLPEQGYENLLAKAEIAGHLGAANLAKAYFSRVQEISPAWPLAYLAEADWLAARQDWPAARRNYILADNSLPSLDDPYINNEHRRIVASYKKKIYQSFGDTYFAEKQYEAAAKFYQAAYRFDAQDLGLLKKIADTYYQRGNLDMAEEYDQRGWARSPQDPAWPTRLSLIYQAKNDAGLANYYGKIAEGLSDGD